MKILNRKVKVPVVVLLAFVLSLSSLMGVPLTANAAIETGEYYGYYNTTNDIRSQDVFMDALYLASGDKQTYNSLIDTLREKVGRNASAVLEKDLNDGAGGDYVYLGWTTTTDPNSAITGVKILNYEGDNPPATKTSDGVTWYLANDGVAVDLNEEAGGDYLFLYVTKDQSYGIPLSAVGYTNNNASPGTGYDKVLNFSGGWQDVNEKAGGEYIYLTVSTALEVIDADDVANLKALVSRAEKLMNAGGYNISSDDYYYKMAKWNILNKWKSTKYANGYDVTQEKVTSTISNLQNYLANITTTVTFDAATNGGEIYGGKTFTQEPVIGEKTTVTVDVSGIVPTPKEGYKFMGWSTEKNATSGSMTTVAANPGATYYAIYRKEITVTFKFYSDYPVTDSKSVTAYLYNAATTTSVTVPSEVIIEFTVDFEHVERNYSLIGWRTDENSESPQYTGSTLQLSDNTTLNAVYETPVYLSFNTQGGNTIDTMTQMQYYNVMSNGGSQVSFTLPTVDTPPEGATFTGWHTTPNAWVGYYPGDTYSCYIDYTMYAYYTYSVAKVTLGDTTTYYTDFQEALNAAMAGTETAPGTVTLMQDIIIRQDANNGSGHRWTNGVGILDLNGHTLSHLNEQSAGRAAILVTGGQLTVRASGTGGSIYSTDEGYNSGTMGVQGTGQLILESGILEAVNSIYCTVFIEGGSFTVNGGEVRNANSVAINVVRSKSDESLPGAVTVNGGAVSGGEWALNLGKLCSATITGGTVSGGYTALIADDAEKITITGGTISSDRKAVEVEGTSYYYELLNILGETELSITGGIYVNRFAVITDISFTLQDLSTVLPNGYGFYDENGNLVIPSSGQTVIEQTVTVKAAHSHGWSADWTYNGSAHWHECSCGYTSDKESHIDEDGDYVCDVCGKQTVVSVEITWGSMEFTYTGGTWNPDTHRYEGCEWAPSSEDADVVSVTNTGELALTVRFSCGFADNSGTAQWTDTDGTLLATDNYDCSLAVGETKRCKLKISDKALNGSQEKTSIGTLTIQLYSVGGD